MHIESDNDTPSLPIEPTVSSDDEMVVIGARRGRTATETPGRQPCENQFNFYLKRKKMEPLY